MVAVEVELEVAEGDALDVPDAAAEREAEGVEVELEVGDGEEVAGLVPSEAGMGVWEEDVDTLTEGAEVKVGAGEVLPVPELVADDVAEAVAEDEPVDVALAVEVLLPVDVADAVALLSPLAVADVEKEADGVAVFVAVAEKVADGVGVGVTQSATG